MSRFTVILEAYCISKSNKPLFIGLFFPNLNINSLASRYFMDCF